MHADKKIILLVNILIKSYVYTVNRYMQRDKNTSQIPIAYFNSSIPKTLSYVQKRLVGPKL